MNLYLQFYPYWFIAKPAPITEAVKDNTKDIKPYDKTIKEKDNSQHRDEYSDDEFASPQKSSTLKNKEKPKPIQQSQDSYSKDSDFKMNSNQSHPVNQNNIRSSVPSTVKGGSNVLLKSKETTNKDTYDEDFEEVEEITDSKPSQQKKRSLVHQSHAVSPKGNRLMGNNSIRSNLAKYNQNAKKGKRNNSSAMSNSDGMQNYSNASMKQYLQKHIKLNTLTKIERDCTKARSKLGRAQSLRVKADEQSVETSQLGLLSQENSILKSELLHMSSNLNLFIDFMREIKTRRNGKHQNQTVIMSRKDKLKVKGAEKKTYKQMSDNMKTEHQRLKNRLLVVGDPTYSTTLRKKLIELKDSIQELEEQKRKLTSDKFIRERRMNKVIMAGQPDVMQTIQDKMQEMTFVFDRVQKINKKLEFQQKTKEESDSKITEVNEKLKRLENEAEEKGIDLGEVYHSETTDSISGASTNPKTYDRKEQIIQQAIQTNQNMYNNKLGDLKTKLEGLLQGKNDSIERIQMIQKQVVEKRKEANELMVKSKMTSQDEISKQNETLDETINEIPPLEPVDEDPMILKMKEMLSSGRKNKLGNVISGAYGRKANVNSSSSKVPTTKNQFNVKNNNKQDALAQL